MDINLLVLSAGHSRLAVGVFAEGELTRVRRLGIDAPQAWQEEIAAAWEGIKDRGRPGIVAASVNAPAARALGEVVAKVTARPAIEWVGDDISLPMPIRTEQPGQTGIDRVLATAAAYEQMQKACIVVDAGTALTINCCNDEGEFLGGAIAPGATMMLEAMHSGTSSLPSVPFDVPTGDIGRDTTQAMRQGVYHALRGLVRDMAERFAETQGQWPEIIATGGDAEKLFGGWELIHAVSPDLLLYGIALAYAEQYAGVDDE